MRISDWSSDWCSSGLRAVRSDQLRVLLARGRLVWLDAADGKSLHQHERVAYERGRDHFSDWTDLGTDHVADVSARCLTSARSGFFMSAVTCLLWWVAWSVLTGILPMNCNDAWN